MTPPRGNPCVETALYRQESPQPRMYRWGLRPARRQLARAFLFGTHLR